MEIDIIRSGGFAGSPEELGPLDIAQLEAATATRIDDILRDLDFFRLARNLTPHPIDDGYTSTLSVVDGHRRHAVSWNASTDTKYREKLTNIVSTLEDAGQRFIDWQRDGELLDWQNTYVATPIFPGTSDILSVAGISESRLTVRLIPARSDEDYSPVEVKGVAAATTESAEKSPWHAVASFAELTGRSGKFVLIGKTKREFFPPRSETG